MREEPAKKERRIHNPLIAVCLCLLAAAVAGTALINSGYSPRLKSAGIRYNCERVANGETGSAVHFTGEQANLASALIASYQASLKQRTGNDIAGMDEYFRIRQRFPDGAEEDYYAYRDGDFAYLQGEPRNNRKSIGLELYELLLAAYDGERQLGLPFDYLAVIDFPERYPPELGRQEGVFVTGHGRILGGTQEVRDRFLEKTRRGEDAEMLVLSYTIDSGPFITRVFHDRLGYQVFTKALLYGPKGSGGFAASGRYLVLVEEEGYTRLYAADRKDPKDWNHVEYGYQVAAWDTEQK